MRRTFEVRRTFLRGDVTIAYDGECKSQIIEPATLMAEGLVLDGYIKITWTIDGYSPKGFKVVKSKVNENPVYPILKGDAYQYLANPDTRASKDYDVMGGETYYYRVCKYDQNHHFQFFYTSCVHF